MRTYTSYGLLILAAYLFLIVTFHRQLQQYDGDQRKSDLRAGKSTITRLFNGANYSGNSLLEFQVHNLHNKLRKSLTYKNLIGGIRTGTPLDLNLPVNSFKTSNSFKKGQELKGGIASALHAKPPLKLTPQNQLLTTSHGKDSHAHVQREMRQKLPVPLQKLENDKELGGSRHELGLQTVGSHNSPSTKPESHATENKSKVYKLYFEESEDSNKFSNLSPSRVFSHQSGPQNNKNHKNNKLKEKGEEEYKKVMAKFKKISVSTAGKSTGHEEVPRAVRRNITARLLRSIQSDGSDFALPSSQHCRDAHRHIKEIEFKEFQAGYIYSAFYDTRKPESRYIRIITLIQKGYFPSMFCKWKDRMGDHVRIEYTVLKLYEMCENHGRIFGGFIASCSVPEHIKDSPCEVDVLHRETHHSGRNISQSIKVPVFVLKDSAVRKKSFAVCIPPLFGKIPVPVLARFIELTRLLGTTHFIFYAFQIDNSIADVLNYYIKRGIATVIPWDVPVRSKQIWYNGQLVAINDCLYRNMGKFEYIAFNDIDEFMVPHKFRDWIGMVKSVPTNKTKGMSGFTFQSAFFDQALRESEDEVYNLESVRRTNIFSRVRTKSMVKPERIFELGIHHISKPIEEEYSPVRMDPQTAFLHHYRSCITDFDPKMKCHPTVPDDYIVKEYLRKVNKEYQKMHLAVFGRLDSSVRL